jgi:hypothetical protein
MTPALKQTLEPGSKLINDIFCSSTNDHLNPVHNQHLRLSCHFGRNNSCCRLALWSYRFHNPHIRYCLQNDQPGQFWPWFQQLLEQWSCLHMNKLCYYCWCNYKPFQVLLLLFGLVQQTKTNKQRTFS